MPIYQIKSDRIEPLATTTFSNAGLKERGDLQRLLRNQVEIISPETLVIAEEFGDWEDSRRRIDLLGVDRQGQLVVIELKRTEDGGHMELQALRYAAMVSQLTFEQAVDIHTNYLASRGLGGDARQRLLAHLEWTEPDEERFAQEVRIVLASAEFSKELTTTVMWLEQECGVDIRCVRLRPYQDAAGNVLLDVQQVIPLPEAKDYQVRMREKSQRERESRGRELRRYDLAVNGEVVTGLSKRALAMNVLRHLCRAHSPEAVAAAVERHAGSFFVKADGRHNPDAMTTEIARQFSAAGKQFDPNRYFFGLDELIYADGHTYAVIGNIWGRDAEEMLRRLCAAFPDCKIMIQDAVD